MSLVPPTDSAVLGHLTIDEVYVAHDGSKFFSAKSRTGRRFLALAVDGDDDSDTFLYLPVSEERFTQIRSGAFELRAAFRSPEDGTLFQVQAMYQQDQNRVTPLSPESVTDDWLPLPGAHIRLSTPTRPMFTPDFIAEESERQGRTVFALEVEPPSLRTEYPLRSFAKVGRLLQETVDALAQEVVGETATRGRLSDRVLTEAELSFLESRAASFVFVLATNMGEALIEPPLARDAASQLIELLKAGQGDDEGLRATLRQHGARAKSKYRAFLQALSDDETGLTFHVAPPDQVVETASLSRALVRNTLEVLRASDTTVSTKDLDSVYLIGAHTRLRTFEVRDTDTDERYSGKMEPDAARQVDGLTLGEQARYRVTLLVEETEPGAGEPTVEYRLLSIEPH